MPITITKDNFQKEVTNSTLPVVLDVYATWCGPCLQMAPIFEELEKEYGNKYKFVKLNVDESREIAINYGVTAIPTFIFIKKNEVVGKETGYITKENLLKKITELLG
jgi:thioredoxin 1